MAPPRAWGSGSIAVVNTSALACWLGEGVARVGWGPMPINQSQSGDKGRSRWSFLMTGGEVVLAAFCLPRRQTIPLCHDTNLHADAYLRGNAPHEHVTCYYSYKASFFVRGFDP
jgi:hypothetical protein